jgi:glutamate/tyrosine decarboxylase-like PLP-dependent enzyme
MRELLQLAAERASSYLETIDRRPVAPGAAAVAALSQLEHGLPAGPGDSRQTLKLLDSIGSAATVASTGPRYFGFVTGGALPVALAANWLAGAWDQNAAFDDNAVAAARFERIALSWLLELFGLPAQCAGSFVTGATMANFCALAAARHALLVRAGWDVESDGLQGAPPLQVVAGQEAHPSLIKALGLLGLGRRRVRPVPVDSQGRMRAETLGDLDERTIVCAQVGNVNTGACDPLEAICERAARAGAWVHVDGAFGLWAAASPARAHLTAGLARADSWATDAHKWLNVPYDSGLAFVRDAQALSASMAVSADYLPAAAELRHPCHFTPELSRRARGVDVWAALHALGRSGVADLVERTCRLAALFGQQLSAAGYPVLNEVVLNQVLVSFGDAPTTAEVVGRVQREGTCWCGATVWQGRPAMRISVSNWATTEQDVERSVAAMVACARAAGAHGSSGRIQPAA